MTDHVMNWNDPYLEYYMQQITGIKGEIWLHDVIDKEDLNLSDYGFIKNSQALSELINLKSLSISLYRGCDLEFIQNLRKIESLEIDGDDTIDLGPLQLLPMLSELSIEGDPFASIEVSNLNILGTLPNLKELHLVDIKHVDFLFLQDATALEKLFLEELGPLKNIKYLSFPPRLKYLDLYDLILKNVDFIQYMKAIEEIDILGNVIFDTAGLSALKKIKKVYLQENELGSLSEAEELPSTEDIEGNTLMDEDTRDFYLHENKDYWKIEEQ